MKFETIVRQFYRGDETNNFHENARLYSGIKKFRIIDNSIPTSDSITTLTRRALGRAHTSAPLCLIHENISGPLHVWNIMLYVVFERDLSMVKNHFKNSRSQIWIQTFTKIESIRRGHTPKMSKFHLNPSTTFWDIVLYIIFGPVSQWWRIT